MKLFKALARSRSKGTAVTDHRDPTILGPYGEGYCRHCRFVVGLTEGGLLNNHVRGAHGLAAPDSCKGSGARPPKVTPYASRKSAFKVSVQKATCPSCTRLVAVIPGSGGLGYLAGHTSDPYRLYVRCPGEYSVWPPRSHQGERG